MKEWGHLLMTQKKKKINNNFLNYWCWFIDPLFLKEGRPGYTFRSAVQNKRETK